MVGIGRHIGRLPGRRINFPFTTQRSSNTPLEHEDLSAYTKVDETGYLTIASTKVTVASMIREAVAYLYKDFGAAYFSDFEIQFEYRVSSDHNDNQASCVLLFVTNDLGTYYNTSDGSAVTAGLEAGEKYPLEVGDRAVAFSHYDFDFDTVYYGTFIRVGAVNSYKLYSDEARTVLVKEVERTDGTTGTTYRYLKVATSYGYAGSYAGAKISCYVDKIKIISHS